MRGQAGGGFCADQLTAEAALASLKSRAGGLTSVEGPPAGKSNSVPTVSRVWRAIRCG